MSGREPFADVDAPDAREVAQLRIPPNSVEAERETLGCLLLEPSAWDRIGPMVESDFYRHEHRLIFAAAEGLFNAGKPVDVLTVYDALERAGKGQEVGGLPYLNSLLQSVISAANVRRYAEIVRERAVLRRLITASDQIAAAAFNPQSKRVDTIVAEAAQLVQSVATEATDDDWQGFDVTVREELERIQNGADEERSKDYIPTGLRDFDDMLDGGLRGGQLVVIGARPSMGKTALADTIGNHVSMVHGLPVGKFSMEMQNREGAQRALSTVGRIPLHALRRPERMTPVHWSDLTAAADKLMRVPFYSTDKGGLNINQLRARARALRRKRGMRLGIVDYFQLMSGLDTRIPRTYQLEEASRGLKALAKELDIPIILLAQVNRGVEKADDQMPRMSDLKDCGSLEQDADVILFLHRPIVAKPDLSDEWKFYAKAHLAKQRGGRTGFLHFSFDGKYTQYTDWPVDVAVPTEQVRVKKPAPPATEL